MAQGWDGQGSGHAAGLLTLCMVGNIVAAICIYRAGGDSWMADVPWAARSKRAWPAMPAAGRGPGAAGVPPARWAEAEGSEAGRAAAASAGAGGGLPPDAAAGEGADAVAAPEAAAADAGGRATAHDASPPAEGGGTGGRREKKKKEVPGKCVEQVINHRVRNRACLEKYRELMLGMAKEPGIDMIFGANDGVQFEPAIHIGYWKRVPHHTRVLVEPVPPLFAKLSKNLANLSTPPVFINQAVKIDAGSEFLDLYCWDTAMVDDWVINGRTSLPEEVRRPEGYWNALCSTEKQQLMGRAHVLDTPTYRGLPPEGRQRVLSEVEAFVQLHHVPAATPEEMVMQVSAREDLSAGNINYVQVDVEAMDKAIVLALPFGKNNFLPKVVLWEGCYLDSEFELLAKHGYESCCCVNIYGANTLAYLP